MPVATGATSHRAGQVTGYFQTDTEDFHHKTLSSFLQAFGDAGFIVRAVREFVPPGRILPWDLALLAEKPS